MKKITNFFILLFAFVGFTSQIYSQAIPGPCNTDGSFAANTTYGLKIYNFTTTNGATNISNTSTNTADTSAINYTSQYLEVYSNTETSIGFSVQVGATNGTSIQISLDSTQDGQFAETEVLFDAYSVVGTNTGTLTIPGTLAEGDYNLRVATVYAQTAYYDTCSLSGVLGEIEDYTLRVSATPSCLPPSGLTVASITNNTATVSWTAGGDETAWEYVVQADGTGVPSGAGTAATNPLTLTALTGLTGNTAFEVYIRANCDGDFSPWVKTTFTTECDPISGAWSNDFENYPNNLDCWKISNGGGANTWTTYNNTTSGGGAYVMAIFYNTTAHDDYLTSPAFTVTDGISDRFTFDARNRSSVYQDKIDVQVWNADNSSMLATILTDVTPGIAFESYTYDLSAYEGQDIRVAFYIDTTNNYQFYIDNVVVDAVPSCLPPSGLTVASITNNTATVSWTAGGDETAWEYVVQADGTGVPSSAGTAATNPLTLTALTGLTGNTAFEVYIRANCDGDFSSWVKTTFTTQCDPISGAWSNDFENYPNHLDCWEITNGGGANTWTTYNNSISGGGSFVMGIAYNTTAHDDYLASPAFTVTGGISDRFTFDARNYSSSSPDIIDVQVWNEDNSAWIATIATGITPGTAFESFTYDLSAYDGQNIRVVFYIATTYQFYMYIDNVVVDTVPTSSWTGAVDSDYNNASNWSPTNVPDASYNVTIPDVANAPIISGSTNASVNDLTITEPDGIIINSGGTLIVNGTSSGNITYNRYLATTNWYLMSSPVVGETYDDAYVTANSIASGIQNTNLRGIAPYNTFSNTWDYMQAGEAATFSAGTGYSVKRSSEGDISFTGTLNTADVSVGSLSTLGNRFNLIGNPYTSHIASVTFLNNEAAISDTKTLWVWNQGTGTSGAYEVKTVADAMVISPAQGFFVKANAAGGIFNFAESNQESSGGTFQRTDLRPEIYLTLSNQTDAREAKIYYIENMTSGFDVGYEGELFNGVSNPLAIYTHLVADSEGKNYQVQSLPTNNYENMVIPVGVNAVSGTTITISASTNNFPAGMNVYLEDNLNNSFTLLEAGSNFTTTLESNQNGIGRFYMHTTTGTLSASDLDLNNNLSIYTSTRDNLRIVGVQNGMAKVQLYNILGKEVLRTSFEGNGVNDISLPYLNIGVYIVKLTTEAGTTNKKIVID